MNSKIILLVVIIFSLVNLAGCMTLRNGNQADNIFPSQENLSKKTVAILSVKSQASITTDSQTPRKKALNKKINTSVKKMSPNAVFIDSQASMDILNEGAKLEVFDKLMTSYDNTGAFDKKLISSLCTALKSDYLLLPKLKVEKMDAVIAKTFISSLEVMLLSKNNSEPVWSGIGDFKRYGAYGLGGTETDEAANELVSLAFGSQ